MARELFLEYLTKDDAQVFDAAGMPLKDPVKRATR
jgi:hypothetical protein